MTTEPTAISRTRTIAGGDQDERSIPLADIPGSLRISARDPLEDLRIDVEVRVDRVDVVLLLERVDQLHQLHGAGLVQRDEGLRPLGDLRLLDLHAGLLQRGAD